MQEVYLNKKHPLKLYCKTRERIKQLMKLITNRKADYNYDKGGRITPSKLLLLFFIMDYLRKVYFVQKKLQTYKDRIEY